MERQGHGFSFEQKVEELFGVDRTNRAYTDKWDGVLRGFPVSIKVAKLGTDIEMADIRRNAYNTEDFYLIVGFWEGEKTNIVKIETLFIPGKDFLFSALYFYASSRNFIVVRECGKINFLSIFVFNRTSNGMV